MPSDRQLRELRSLTPWNWDAKSWTKHPPGQAALRDFERIEQACLSQPGQGRTRLHDDAIQGKFSTLDAQDKGGEPNKDPAASVGWEAQTPRARDSMTDKAGQKHKRHKRSSSSTQDAASVGKASSGFAAADTSQHPFPTTPATVPYHSACNNASQHAPMNTPTTHFGAPKQPSGCPHASTPLPLGLSSSGIHTPCPQQHATNPGKATHHSGSISAADEKAEPLTDLNDDLALGAAMVNPCSGMGCSQLPPASGTATTTHMLPPSSGSSLRPLHKRQHRRMSTSTATTTPTTDLNLPPAQQQQVRGLAGKRRTLTEPGGDKDTERGYVCEDGLMQLAAVGLQHFSDFDSKQERGKGARSEQSPEMDASLTLLSMAPTRAGSFTFAQHHAVAAAPAGGAAQTSSKAMASPTAPNQPLLAKHSTSSAAAESPASPSQSPPARKPFKQLQVQPKCMQPQEPSCLKSCSLHLAEVNDTSLHASSASPKPDLHGMHASNKQQQLRTKQASLPFPNLGTISSSSNPASAVAAPAPAVRPQASMKENVPPPAAPQRAPSAALPTVTAQHKLLLAAGKQQLTQQQGPLLQQQPQQGLPHKHSAKLAGHYPAHGSTAAAPGMDSYPTPAHFEAGSHRAEATAVLGQQPVASLGTGVSVLSTASMAALHHIVRAVATYCHSLNIKPSGDNVQQAQLIIDLLHAGQPAQACELLHGLRPQPEGFALPAMEAMAALPIAPLALPNLDPAGQDWCPALHPTTHLALHALTAGHKALRDAMSAAAYPPSRTIAAPAATSFNPAPLSGDSFAYATTTAPLPSKLQPPVSSCFTLASAPQAQHSDTHHRQQRACLIDLRNSASNAVASKLKGTAAGAAPHTLLPGAWCIGVNVPSQY